jgi:hypothetical protein
MIAKVNNYFAGMLGTKIAAHNTIYDDVQPIPFPVGTINIFTFTHHLRPSILPREIVFIPDPAPIRM